MKNMNDIKKTVKLDQTSWLEGFVLGIQHTILALGSLIFPIILIREIGGSLEETINMLSITAIIIAVFSFLQSTRWGAGHFVAHHANPIYLPQLITAGQLGGFGLVCGMTVFSGFCKAGLSQVLKYLKILFPPEVCGIVIFLNGIALSDYAVAKFLGLTKDGNSIDTVSFLIALTTLAVMLAFSILKNRMWRRYALIFGLVSGYVLTALFSRFDASANEIVKSLPIISFPKISIPDFSFNPGYIFPFLLLTIASSADSMGVLITYQKARDGADWQKPDMKSVGNGIKIAGLGSITAGLFGGMINSTGTSNAGLSLATGNASKRLVPFFVVFFLALSFLPRATALLSVMPTPVSGAVLLYIGSFMICTGTTMMAGRLFDIQRVFVVGISLMGALAIPQLEGVLHTLSAPLQALMGTSISVGSLLAITLSLLFRLAIPQSVKRRFSEPVDKEQQVLEHIEDYCRHWGIPVIKYNYVHQAVMECFELLNHLGYLKDSLMLQMKHTDERLTISFEYVGAVIDLKTDSSVPERILEDEAAFYGLAMNIIKNNVDSIDSSKLSNDRIRLQLDWDLVDPRSRKL